MCKPRETLHTKDTLGSKNNVFQSQTDLKNEPSCYDKELIEVVMGTKLKRIPVFTCHIKQALFS